MLNQFDRSSTNIGCSGHGRSRLPMSNQIVLRLDGFFDLIKNSPTPISNVKEQKKLKVAEYL
jgi:hypothetical protein